MEPSVLHSQIPIYEVQDDSLYFILGLAHAADLLRRWAGQFRVPASGDAPNNGVWQANGIPPYNGDGKSSATPARLPAQEPAADDCLYFFLGLLCFAEHYDRVLIGMRAGQPPAPKSGDASQNSEVSTNGDMPADTAIPTLAAQIAPQDRLVIRDLLR